MRSIPALLAFGLFLAALPGAQAQSASFDIALFMTDAEHPDGGEVLSFSQGTSAATHMFSPLLGGLVEQVGPTSYSWTTQDAFSVDVVVQGATDVILHFDNGAEVMGTTTVALRTVVNSTATPIGQATHEGTLEVAAHTESFSLPTDGAILRAGSTLRLDVSISGLEPDVLVQLQYGDDATPSGVERLTFQILDTDGDGFGDTAERTAGTDPNDPLSYPGAPPLDDQDDDGLKDDWEDANIGHRNATGSDDGDGDGCDNLCEQAEGTDPNNPDTDGDSALDGDELAAGTNPLVAQEPETTTEAVEPNPEPWRATAFFASSLLVAGFALLGRFT